MGWLATEEAGSARHTAHRARDNHAPEKSVNVFWFQRVAAIPLNCVPSLLADPR